MKDLISEVRPYEGFTFARVEGEIDMANAAEFAEALAQAIDGATAGLIVDFSAVAFIDSAGVRALFDIVRHLESRRHALAMVVPETSAVRTLIKVTNLHEAIPVCESPEECATALSLAEGIDDDRRSPASRSMADRHPQDPHAPHSGRVQQR